MFGKLLVCVEAGQVDSKSLENSVVLNPVR